MARHRDHEVAKPEDSVVSTFTLHLPCHTHLPGLSGDPFHDLSSLHILVYPALDGSRQVRSRHDSAIPLRSRCTFACRDALLHVYFGVPKTVQIRDLDDEVYAALLRRAAESGISVPELLRAEAVRLAARPSLEEWLRRTRRRSSPVGRLEIIAALDEHRGSWPDAGS